MSKAQTIYLSKETQAYITQHIHADEKNVTFYKQSIKRIFTTCNNEE